MAAWPGPLVSFLCYTLQSLGCYEEYRVSLCLPGLLLLLPVERAGHWCGRMCQSLMGACVNRLETLSSHARKSKVSVSGHHKSVQAGSASPAKTGFSVLGITKQSLT